METGLSYFVPTPCDGTRVFRPQGFKLRVKQYWDREALLYDVQEYPRKYAVALLQLADICRGLKVIDIGSGNDTPYAIMMRHHFLLLQASSFVVRHNDTASQTTGQHPHMAAGLKHLMFGYAAPKLAICNCKNSVSSLNFGLLWSAQEGASLGRNEVVIQSLAFAIFRDVSDLSGTGWTAFIAAGLTGGQVTGIDVSLTMVRKVGYYCQVSAKTDTILAWSHTTSYCAGTSNSKAVALEKR